MKKFKYFLSLAAVLLGIVSASAYDEETVNSYAYDFNLSGYSSTTTLESGWAPPGWAHIVDSYSGYWETYTVDYAYVPTGGVDYTGAIRISSQNLGSSWDGYEAKDLLVTPLVSGQVTLQVLQNTYDGSIKFYSVDEENGNYTAGTEITDTTMSGSLTMTGKNFVTVTVDAGTTPRRIGIRGSGVFIDNFTAATATIVKKPSLKIQSLKNVSGESVDADADGNFDVKFKAVVVNNGLTDFNPGDENFSLSLLLSDSTLVKEVPIEVAMPQGTSDTVDVNATLNVSNYPAGERVRFLVRENIGRTFVDGGYVVPVAYAPQFSIREDGSRNVLADSTKHDFGMTKEALTQDYIIVNDCAKQLDITSVDVPEGFSVTPSAPITIAAHKQDTVSVTLNNNVIGDKAGTIVLKMNELPDFHIYVSGTVVDSTKWFVNFEDHRIPTNVIAEGDNWQTSSFPTDMNLGGNKYCVYQNQNGDPNDHLISPKLHVNAGDVLQFQAARGDRATMPVLYVFYSRDRRNWTLAQTISSDDSIPEEYQFSTEQTRTSYGNNYNFKTFTIRNIPEGDLYVGFSGTYFYLDNIYGFTEVPVSHDIMVSDITKPVNLSVNTSSQFTVKAHNSSAKDETAGSYTAKLFVGSNSYDADAVKIESGEDATYTVNVTPHAVGTFPVYFVIETPDGYVSTSDTTSVTVTPEVAATSHQVGTPENTDQFGLIKLYDKKSQSVSVYTPSEIQLSAGTAIHGLTIRGYNPKDIPSIDLQLYFRSTDKTSMDGDDAASEIEDTTNFTKVYAGTVSLPEMGSADSFEDLIHVTFAEPYVYNGGNLEIAANSSASTWSRATFEITSISGQSAGRSNDNSLTGGFEDMSLPVIYLDVDRTPTNISGTVTSKSTSQPIEGVPVKFVSGDVEYSDTTGADGKYSVQIIQDNLAYQLQAVKAGFTPEYADNLSLTKDTTINISLADASGFYVLNKDIPATGNINSAFSATARALNTEAADIDSAAYSATLYFNDEAVAEAEAVKVAAGGNADYAFNFTPHKSGQFKAYIKFVYGDKVTVSDSADVTVGDEIATREVRVNTPTRFSQYVPFFTYDKHGQSEMIYKASQLGIAAGSKIKSITFRGYHSAPYSTGYSPLLSAYIENTDDDTTKSYGTSLVDTATMTCIASDSVITSLQESAGSSSNAVDVIKLNIPEGFVYTGGNIRLVCTNNTENGYLTVYYETDDNVDPKQTAYRGNDNDVESQSFTSGSSGQPVAYLEVETEGTVSGKITNALGEAIPGAVVSLTNADVLYTDTTDADGNYDISVKKIDRDYDVTVSADGYVTDTKPAAVTFGESSDVVVNDVLVKYIKATGTVTGVDLQNGGIVSAPIAGASVTVADADGNVIATLVTASDGTYSVDSLLDNTAYAFSFSADGYESKDTTLDVQSNDFTVEATLYTQTYLGINGITVSSNRKATGNVYNLAGKLVGRNINVADLPRGVYIIDGKKVTMK